MKKIPPHLDFGAFDLWPGLRTKIKPRTSNTSNLLRIKGGGSFLSPHHERFHTAAVLRKQRRAEFWRCGPGSPLLQLDHRGGAERRKQSRCWRCGGIAISPIDAEKQTEFLSRLPPRSPLFVDSDAAKSKRACFIGRSVAETGGGFVSPLRCRRVARSSVASYWRTNAQTRRTGCCHPRRSGRIVTSSSSIQFEDGPKADAGGRRMRRRRWPNIPTSPVWSAFTATTVWPF